MAKDTFEDEGVALTDASPDDYNFILKRERMQMGWMGLIIGNKDHAPTGVAGVVALILLVVMGVCAIWGGPEKLELIKVFGGFLLAAIGYLFGSISSSRR